MKIFRSQIGHNNENICYVKIDAEICDDLYEKCLETKDNVGLTKNQLWRYLLAQGLSNEYTTRESACILSDYDILNEIDKLNIPRLKAFTLIRYLIENNILIAVRAFSPPDSKLKFFIFLPGG